MHCDIDQILLDFVDVRRSSYLALGTAKDSCRLGCLTAQAYLLLALRTWICDKISVLNNTRHINILISLISSPRHLDSQSRLTPYQPYKHRDLHLHHKREFSAIILSALSISTTKKFTIAVIGNYMAWLPTTSMDLTPIERTRRISFSILSAKTLEFRLLSTL